MERQGRPIALFTGQWADLPLGTLLPMIKEWGYDGAELGCWGDHFDPVKATNDHDYCKDRIQLMKDNGLGLWAISTHLDSQAVCDRIDLRHKAIVSEWVWGDGYPAGVNKRAAESVMCAAHAAAKLSEILGYRVKVNGFTGSSLWHLI